MNMNQIVNMVVRAVLRQVIGRGVNAGINAASKRFSGAGDRSQDYQTADRQGRLPDQRGGSAADDPNQPPARH